MNDNNSNTRYFKNKITLLSLVRKISIIIKAGIKKAERIINEFIQSFCIMASHSQFLSTLVNAINPKSNRIIIEERVIINLDNIFFMSLSNLF